jgi:hypothetical protein
MSLRMFHLAFIALSTVLAAFCAAWAAGQYRLAHDPACLLAAAGSLAGAAGLAVYGAAFQRKTKGIGSK